MDREPKGSLLPFAIGGGALLVCCLGPVLLASGGAGLTAWIGGIDPLLAAGIAMAVLAAAVVFRRIRKSTPTEVRRVPRTHPSKGIQ